MYPTPDLSILTAPCTTALAELREIDPADIRGGPQWDLFREGPEVRLSSQAQAELVEAFRESEDLEQFFEGKLSRARSARSRRQWSRRLYLAARVSTWAQELLVSSLSLLLVSRIEIAVRRHGDSQVSRDEYMSDALVCAIECLRTWSADGGAKLHQYVASSVDAALSKRSLDGRVTGSMPTSWGIVMRHLPSLVQDLSGRLGREPSDHELRDAFLARARSWTEARIIEKGGEVAPDVLRELVEAKLTKQGLISAANDITAIRLRTATPHTLSEPEEFGPLASTSTASPEDSFAHKESLSTLRCLVDAIPGMSVDDLSSLDTGVVRDRLMSPIWRRLVLGHSLPVTAVSRRKTKAPDPVAMVATH